ncbi:hypothetical protein FQR65_LT03999 [Abscondita terminalis]|nr:hypothetical protein FQR65_LT03999 [Abscondita terminalis]
MASAEKIDKIVVNQFELHHIFTSVSKSELMQSPILFYVSDVCSATIKGDVVAFAYDSAQYYEADNACEHFTKIEQELAEAGEWLNAYIPL